MLWIATSFGGFCAKLSPTPPVTRRARLVRQLIRVSSLGLGIAVSVVALQGFIVPNSFFDGGVVGISLFLAELTGGSLPWLMVLINAPFILVGWRQIGWRFALVSIAAVSGFALALAVVHLAPITGDKLLGAVFGGFFLGAGIGLAIRADAVLDGTEIAALVISRHSSLTVGNVILAFNLVLFATIALVLDVERALYSMLTYFVAARAIDLVVHGVEEFSGVLIISQRSEPIRQAVVAELGRGVTVLNGRSGYVGTELEVLFVVISRLEITRLKALVADHDPEAFVVLHKVDDLVGGTTPRALKL